MEKNKIVLLSFIIASLLIFFVVAILVLTDTTANLDKFCFDIFTTNRLRFFNWLFVFATILGETKIIVLASIVLLALPNRKKIGISLVITVVISALINLLIKIIFQRARPVGYFLENAPLGYTMPTSYSFPSGHAQTATVFYFVLTYLLCKHYVKKDWLRILLWCVTLAFCVLIPISRVYLGVHFFSDIVCGIMLAIAITSTFIFAHNYIDFKRILHKNKQT